VDWIAATLMMALGCRTRRDIVATSPSATYAPSDPGFMLAYVYNTCQAFICRTVFEYTLPDALVHFQMISRQQHIN
jgi:hypothetical protein